MQVADSYHLDVRASVYVMNVGDKLPRHSHDVEHTCHVLVGAVEVEIYDGRPISMLYAKNRDFCKAVLPPGIDHEIRALLPGTVMINMMHRDGKLILPEQAK
jgi:hypothetical protein